MDGLYSAALITHCTKINIILTKLYLNYLFVCTCGIVAQQTGCSIHYLEYLSWPPLNERGRHYIHFISLRYRVIVNIGLNADVSCLLLAVSKCSL